MVYNNCSLSFDFIYHVHSCFNSTENRTSSTIVNVLIYLRYKHSGMYHFIDIFTRVSLSFRPVCITINNHRAHACEQYASLETNTRTYVSSSLHDKYYYQKLHTRLKRWYNEECKHNISDVIV